MQSPIFVTIKEIAIEIAQTIYIVMLFTTVVIIPGLTPLAIWLFIWWYFNL